MWRPIIVFLAVLCLSTHLSGGTLADFDGDGKSDIVWRNRNTGETLIWSVQADGSIQTLGPYVRGSGATDQHAVAVGELGGSFTAADILWHHGDSRSLSTQFFSSGLPESETVWPVETSPSPGTVASAYGDSITVGYTGSTLDPAQGWVSGLTGQLGWTITRRAYSGSLLQDAGQTDVILATHVTPTTTSLLLSGYNDMRAGGTDPARLATYSGALRTALAWLAIPSEDRFEGQSSSITYGGVWSNSSIYGGAVAKVTQQNGATATVKVYGNAVYVASVRLNTAESSIAVSVDGVSHGPYSCSGASVAPSSGNRNYAPFLVRIPGLSDGPHTVVVTATTNGTAPAYLLFVAGNAGVRVHDGATVYLGTCLRMNATGYAAGAPSWNHGSDAAAALYHKEQVAACADFASDGLNTVAVYTHDRYDPNDPLQNGNDNVHPSVAGHDRIEDAFAADITGMPADTTVLSVLADLDGNGTDEALMRNLRTGETSRWMIFGTPAAVVKTSIHPGANLSWNIIAAGDFDGDGKDEILWRNTINGSTLLWFMQDHTILSSKVVHYGGNTEWTIAGVGDLDGDGKCDIFWRHNPTGMTLLWSMNGVTIRSSTVVHAGNNHDWTVAGIGDFDGDGRSDVFWRKPATGETRYWQMNGAVISRTVDLREQKSAEWEVVGPAL